MLFENSIKFLGTAGGRVAVFRQLRYSGGMWLNLNNKNILIDPGPGSLVRIFEFGLDPKDIDIIVISHRHLDHTADLNTVIESASSSNTKPIELLIAPSDVINGEDPILLKYLHKGIKDIQILENKKEINLDNIYIKGTVEHIHFGALTYGIEFISEEKRVVYVPCGKYYDDMLEGYQKNADLEIFNTTFYKPKEQYFHLSAFDVIKMLKVHKPKKAIITHFSPYILRENPEKVAEEITKESLVKTIAAKDGLVVKF